MTAFITHCWKNARLDLLAVLACACLAGGLGAAAQAQTAAPDIALLKLERAGPELLLSTTVKLELSDAVEDALLKGVALIFVAEAEVFRERWYWTNKRVAHAERHLRLAYQPLTRRWRLNVASAAFTNAGLGMALNLNFDTLTDAMAALQRLSRWKIADVTELDPTQRHLVQFHFRLDISQLPRPFQIGTLGQSDWNISVSARQALLWESKP